MPTTICNAFWELTMVDRVFPNLLMMASSVSSERTFSSTGITISISKWRNRLKGNIIKALQTLKCLFHHDLIFWEVSHSSVIEKELDGEEIVDVDIDSGEAFGQGKWFSWDKPLADDRDDDKMPIN